MSGIDHKPAINPSKEFTFVACFEELLIAVWPGTRKWLNDKYLVDNAISSDKIGERVLYKLKQCYNCYNCLHTLRKLLILFGALFKSYVSYRNASNADDCRTLYVESGIDESAKL